MSNDTHEILDNLPAIIEALRARIDELGGDANSDAIEELHAAVEELRTRFDDGLTQAHARMSAIEAKIATPVATAQNVETPKTGDGT